MHRINVVNTLCILSIIPVNDQKSLLPILEKRVVQ